jgi:ABC-type uncharacterized transport system ATPase subunit
MPGTIHGIIGENGANPRYVNLRYGSGSVDAGEIFGLGKRTLIPG